MDDEGPFESSRYLIRFAEKEIADLEAAIRAFHDTKPYAVLTELNPQTGQYELKIKGVRPLPWQFRGAASNIIKNLRDALDQAVASATELITGRENAHSHFPFGEGPDDLENSLSRRKAGRCKGIAPELYDVLRRAEPYPTRETHPGGNDILKVLNKVSGPNKHKVTITTSARIGEHTYGGGLMKFGKGGGRIGVDDRWDRAKNQFVLMAFGADAVMDDVKVQAAMDVAFNNSFLRDVPVIDFLRSALIHVTKVVEDVAAEALRIGPRD